MNLLGSVAANSGLASVARCSHSASMVVKRWRHCSPWPARVGDFEQPAVDGGDAAQAGEGDGVRPERCADDLETFPDQRREQVRSRPQVGCRTGLGDEALDGAEAHAEQGRFVVGERAGERRNGVQVRPDRVVGYAGVGGQDAPEIADFRRDEGRLRAETPEGEIRQPQVGLAVASRSIRSLKWSRLTVRICFAAMSSRLPRSISSPDRG
jgi:hypothetical protein